MKSRAFIYRKVKERTRVALNRSNFNLPNALRAGFEFLHKFGNGLGITANQERIIPEPKVAVYAKPMHASYKVSLNKRPQSQIGKGSGMDLTHTGAFHDLKRDVTMLDKLIPKQAPEHCLQ
jgi:hypothetical protein